MQIWRVAGLQQDEQTEFEFASIDFPLVGRDEEIGLLHRAWQQTKEEGHGQVVFVSGEAGVGKSALIDTLRRATRAEGSTRITFRCSHYHTNSALYPISEHWKRLLGWRAEDDRAAGRGSGALRDIVDCGCFVGRHREEPLNESRMKALSF